jgi:DNA-binding MarR family transcriptional regulator
LKEDVKADSQHDSISQGATMDSLNEQLCEPALRSSTRLLILILLSVHKRTTLVELRKFTGLGRSSLANHLEKLELAGYVKTRVVRSFVGRRQVIEITEKGEEDCRTLLNTIRKLEV